MAVIRAYDRAGVYLPVKVSAAIPGDIVPGAYLQLHGPNTTGCSLTSYGRVFCPYAGIIGSPEIMPVNKENRAIMPGLRF